MIVAVSGKISSGKDTIGKIIQCLTQGINSNKQILDYCNGVNIVGFEWEIKKFADSLKDMVCILIGCTREQLEDPVFKNTELGEEWNCWINNSSKITNPPQLSIEKPDDFFNDLGGVSFRKMTPRLLLQLLGTECGRQIIHPNIWVNSLMSEYDNYEPVIRTRRRGLTSLQMLSERELRKGETPNWIITDTRFPNELKAVKDRGGITIRVNRTTFRTQETEFGKISTVIQPEVDNLLGIQEHPSETALDDAEFDCVIDNNGSVEELIEKVREILINKKII